MNLVQTPRFEKQSKKLHPNQKIDLNEALKKIIKDPLVGILKKGDLSGVRVFKFKMANQLTLLAYQFDEGHTQIVLIALGSHENFCKNLKK